MYRTQSKFRHVKGKFAAKDASFLDINSPFANGSGKIVAARLVLVLGVFYLDEWH